MTFNLNFDTLKGAEHGKLKIPYGIFNKKSNVPDSIKPAFSAVLLFIPYGIFSLFFGGLLQEKGVYMETISKEKQSVSPEKAVALLKEQGIDLMPEQAVQVVEFFYALALIFYHQQDEL